MKKETKMLLVFAVMTWAATIVVWVLAIKHYKRLSEDELHQERKIETVTTPDGSVWPADRPPQSIWNEHWLCAICGMDLSSKSGAIEHIVLVHKNIVNVKMAKIYEYDVGVKAEAALGEP